MEQIARTLRLLAEPTRLRLLRLLADEPLNVGELTAILGIAQPSVSKQLGELKRAGLVREERDGGFAFYRVSGNGSAPGPGGGSGAGVPGAALWRAVAAEIEKAGDPDGDLARRAEVLRRREERGGGVGRLIEPGRSWPAWARALGFLMPPLTVADLGCGDGALTTEIARWARHVTAVDHDAAVLARARARLRGDNVRNVTLKRASIEALDLQSARFDAAVLSQALHACADVAAALREAWRILRPGGHLLLLDLAPHGETWVRERLGHAHLGFRPADLRSGLEQAGFEAIVIEEIRRGAGQPFRVLIGSALRPASRPVRKA